MIKYYQITSSIDESIVGKSELPLNVRINDDAYFEQRKKYTLDISRYFDEKDNIYNIFSRKLVGTLYQRDRSPIDIMQSLPYHPVIEFIISERVKKIFEHLNIDCSEYHLEELSIEGSEEKFYFLFIPLLKNYEYVDYQKSIYYDGFNDIYVVFGGYEKYEIEKKKSNYRVKTLYVKKELEGRDIISVQAGGPFYSARIIEAFQKENVIGYEIISRGDSKVDLYFI